MDDESLEEIMRDAIKHSIWSVPSVEDEPVVRLTSWRVFELEGLRHLVGYHAAGYEGRVSTRIIEIQPGLRFITASGRVYLLEGPSGFDRDASYVLDRWLHGRKLSRRDIRFVSMEELQPESGP
jgi:hypothetical protein